ncbi:MAG: hypothetical protein F6K48_11545 [Okeania sp. SIO3H1]|nr:hypothetical protein [Okeania sp. SIO3H1]
MESLLLGVGVRIQETGDNPPLTPPRRGDMGMSEEVGAKFCKNYFSAQLCA